MDGGSGSFVSAEGLMITNHHVGRGCIQNVSSREHDYMANGFLAASRDQELACPGYEVNVLVSFEDVSARVKGATKPSASDQAARETRKAEMTRLEDECVRKTGLRCDVVALYQGGEYWLYRYKKYTDVRLVFAPEGQIAFFGGDSDNFTYPRHDLDICLMRAYEGAKPAKPAAFLRVAPEGTKEGDLVFISGHPGSTSRLLTMAQLEALRDWELPDRLAFIARRLGVLREFGARSPESLRRAQSDVFGLANAEKGLTGRKDALEDAPELQKLAAAEKALREKVAADPAVRAATGDAWEVVAAATARSVARLAELRYAGFQGSRTLAIAAHLVRLPVEVRKPSASRLEEYVDASLPSLKNKLFSAAPIHADLEEATLADQLSLSLEKLGPDHAFVKAALGGKTPAEAAKAALAGTRLFEVSARKALFDGGTAAVLASSDSMIALARRIDPVNRQIRTWYETEVDAPPGPRGREDRGRALRGLREDPSPRRHLHPAPLLRQREELAHGGLACAGLHHLLRPLRPLGRFRRPRALAAAGALARAAVGVEPGDPLQLRLHQRHHRRQLGQPGGGPRGPLRGHRLRRQHREPGLGLLLHRGPRTLRQRGRARHRGSLEEALRSHGAPGGAGDLSSYCTSTRTRAERVPACGTRASKTCSPGCSGQRVR